MPIPIQILLYSTLLIEMFYVILIEKATFDNLFSEQKVCFKGFNRTKGYE